MKIWGIKENGHDNSLTVVRDGVLESHVEVCKVGLRKSAPLGIHQLLSMVGNSPAPDALSLTGAIGPLYESIERQSISRSQLFSTKDLPTQYCPHARSHLITSYVMSPFAGRDAYCLLWEGTIGRFYEISADLTIRALGDGDVVVSPGMKYRALYDIVSRAAGDRSDSGTAAGTLMALISEADDKPPLPHLIKGVTELIRSPSNPYGRDETTFRKGVIRDLFAGINDLHNMEYLRACKFASDLIFSMFAKAATELCDRNLPLVIAGGCGYNCDWNNAWHDLEWFSDVFVPPAPGDAGVSIGATIDLQHTLTGSYKLDWNVFSGPELVLDYDRVGTDWVPETASASALAGILASGEAVPVAYGRAEIGPRALGHRSILIDPTLPDAQDTMNRIKKRQKFRPVAPMCTEDRVSEYFHWTSASPFMLYFQQVADPRLVGVTHVDGTARLQTVTKESDSFMYDTLKEFGKLRGVEVLCNSSLNFPGMGFLGSVRDVRRFAEENNLKYFLAGDRIYRKKES